MNDRVRLVAFEDQEPGEAVMDIGVVRVELKRPGECCTCAGIAIDAQRRAAREVTFGQLGR